MSSYHFNPFKIVKIVIWIVAIIAIGIWLSSYIG